MRRPSKTIQGQSQCVDRVGGVAVRQVRFVIKLGVGVRGQTKTERGNLDACQFNFALFICSSEKQETLKTVKCTARVQPMTEHGAVQKI